jgi:acid phosphatase
MVVMMENKNASQVIGQSDQPYTNSLARTYGLATESYAFGHPSLPNYLDIVSGSNQGVTDDNPPSSHDFPDAMTLADQLVEAGFSAKAYAENLPPDPKVSVGEYAVRHVPWEYFPNAKISVVDASLMLGDLDSADAPDFVWYTPNLIDDEHDGTVEEGDAFLSRLIPQVQSTSWYRAGGVIILEWDESDDDNSGINGSGGGGHIPTIVISAALQAHPEQDSTPVDTAGILGSIEDAYGLGHLGTAGSPTNGDIDALLGVAPGGARS